MDSPIKQKQIPEELKKIALSVEIYDQAEKVGNLFGLHIDQIGELDKEIRSILMGLRESSNFVADITKNLEIEKSVAEQIAQEINKSIFATIKTNMKSEVVANEFTTSSLERIGDITIEKQMPEPENGKVTSADRGDILANLENPPATTISHTSPPPQNLPTSEEVGPFDEPAKLREDHTEPLVDYLLKNPASQSTNATPPITTQPKPKASGSSDPYREQIK